MIVAAILLGISEILAVFLAYLLVRHVIRAERAEIEAKLSEFIHEWVDQPAPDQPNKAAELVDKVGAILGGSIVRSFKADAMASASHASRTSNSLVAQAQAQANPIGAILGRLGPRGKGASVIQLAQIVAGMIGTKQNHDGDSGQKGSFEL